MNPRLCFLLLYQAGWNSLFSLCCSSNLFKWLQMDLHSLNILFLSHQLSCFLWQTSQANSITRGDKESGSVPEIWSQLALFCWANCRCKSCVQTINWQNNRLLAGALCFLMVVQTGWFSSAMYRHYMSCFYEQIPAVSKYIQSDHQRMFEELSLAYDIQQIFMNSWLIERAVMRNKCVVAVLASSHG